MGPPPVVRSATPADLTFVAQDGYLPERIVSRKIGEGDAFVAWRGETPIGYLRLERLWSRLPYIELIRVLAPYRRTGVGRSLLSFVETELLAQGHAVLYSSSQADEPEPQAWHRRMGFEECGMLSGMNAGGVGEVFFRKQLAAGSNPLHDSGI